MFAALLALAALIMAPVEGGALEGAPLVLVCSFGALVVLRSGVVTATGIQGPANSLLRWRSALSKEIDTKIGLDEAAAADEATKGLTWELEADALAVTCNELASHGNATSGELKKMVANADRSAQTPKQKMFLLAQGLRKRFGLTVLKAAAKAVIENRANP